MWVHLEYAQTVIFLVSHVMEALSTIASPAENHLMNIFWRINVSTPALPDITLMVQKFVNPVIQDAAYVQHRDIQVVKVATRIIILKGALATTQMSVKAIMDGPMQA